MQVDCNGGVSGIKRDWVRDVLSWSISLTLTIGRDLLLMHAFNLSCM